MATMTKRLGEKATIVMGKCDYYDKINDGYVVYIKDWYEFTSIPVEAMIVDSEGTEWSCWLFSAEFVPHTKEYELIYKEY